MNPIILKTDVLIAGGGTSGVCAAIQAARLGVGVVLVEETNWLGGMLTAAGVSAIDGNHKLPSGLWGEFRNALYEHYGGPEAVETGWVSNTLFEPRAGNDIFQRMVKTCPEISAHYGYFPVDVLKENGIVAGVIFENAQGEKLIVHAKITIDATEYGDILTQSGCAYAVGRDSRNNTGEPEALARADEYIQDITYVAILKDFGTGADKTIPRPVNYDPQNYAGICREASQEATSDLVDCQTMLEYGRLPNDKFMLNWPNSGNDFYLNIIEMDWQQRKTELEKAKNFTLGCLYFIQTELGKKHIGLAREGFPTQDSLPLIPYNRESRRLRGLRQLSTREIVSPYSFELYKTGIAVGDYPLDHHHKKAPVEINENFPSIPAFNVPFGCLVPEAVDGLLVAEKSISVTHLVNGCTRLQPVAMQIGQAAGAAAALCVKQGIEPRAIDIRNLQQILLDADCWLLPFCDVAPSEPEFQSVQRIGLCGVLKGELISKDWANEMRFQPEQTISALEFWHALNIAANHNAPLPKEFDSSNEALSFAQAFTLIDHFLNETQFYSEGQLAFNRSDASEGRRWFNKFKEDKRSRATEKFTRKNAAVLLDKIFDPFHSLQVHI